MDFSNHPLQVNRSSIIDQTNSLNQSIIDSLTIKLRSSLNDNTIGSALVAKALKHLGEGQVLNIADYASRKAHTPGRAFVSICKKELDKKGV